MGLNEEKDAVALFCARESFAGGSGELGVRRFFRELDLPAARGELFAKVGEIVEEEILLSPGLARASGQKSDGQRGLRDGAQMRSTWILGMTPRSSRFT